MQDCCCCCCCCCIASVVSDSVWPHRRQPTRLPCPWDSPGKNTAVGCHFLLQCMIVKSEREVNRFWLFATPSTAAYQAPPSMGFSRQEYWSGVPLLSPDAGLLEINSLHFCLSEEVFNSSSLLNDTLARYKIVGLWFYFFQYVKYFSSLSLLA